MIKLELKYLSETHKKIIGLRYKFSPFDKINKRQMEMILKHLKPNGKDK